MAYLLTSNNSTTTVSQFYVTDATYKKLRNSGVINAFKVSNRISNSEFSYIETLSSVSSNNNTEINNELTEYASQLSDLAQEEAENTEEYTYELTDIFNDWSYINSGYKQLANLLNDEYQYISSYTDIYTPDEIASIKNTDLKLVDEFIYPATTKISSLLSYTSNAIEDYKTASDDIVYYIDECENDITLVANNDSYTADDKNEKVSEITTTTAENVATQTEKKSKIQKFLTNINDGVKNTASVLCSDLINSELSGTSTTLTSSDLFKKQVAEQRQKQKEAEEKAEALAKEKAANLGLTNAEYAAIKSSMDAQMDEIMKKAHEELQSSLSTSYWTKVKDENGVMQLVLVEKDAKIEAAKKAKEELTEQTNKAIKAEAEKEISTLSETSSENAFSATQSTSIDTTDADGLTSTTVMVFDYSSDYQNLKSATNPYDPHVVDDLSLNKPEGFDEQNKIAVPNEKEFSKIWGKYTAGESSVKQHGITYPIVMYNNTLLMPEHIKYFNLDCTGFIPKLTLQLFDPDGKLSRMSNSGTLDYVIVWLQDGVDNVYKNVKLAFNRETSVDFTSDSQKKSKSSIIYYKGIYAIPKGDGGSFQDFGNYTTYDLFRTVAKKLGVGFSAMDTCEVCNDKRQIMPIIKRDKNSTSKVGTYVDILKRALLNGGFNKTLSEDDSDNTDIYDTYSVFDGFIDAYNYLTLIDLTYLWSSKVEYDDLTMKAHCGIPPTVVDGPELQTKCVNRTITSNSAVPPSNFKFDEDDIQIIEHTANAAGAKTIKTLHYDSKLNDKDFINKAQGNYEDPEIKGSSYRGNYLTFIYKGKYQDEIKASFTLNYTDGSTKTFEYTFIPTYGNDYCTVTKSFFDGSEYRCEIADYTTIPEDLNDTNIPGWGMPLQLQIPTNSSAYYINHGNNKSALPIKSVGIKWKTAEETAQESIANMGKTSKTNKTSKSKKTKNAVKKLDTSIASKNKTTKADKTISEKTLNNLLATVSKADNVQKTPALIQQADYNGASQVQNVTNFKKANFNTEAIINISPVNLGINRGTLLFVAHYSSSAQEKSNIFVTVLQSDALYQNLSQDQINKIIQDPSVQLPTGNCGLYYVNGIEYIYDITSSTNKKTDVHSITQKLHLIKIEKSLLDESVEQDDIARVNNPMIAAWGNPLKMLKIKDINSTTVTSGTSTSSTTTNTTTTSDGGEVTTE